MRKLLIIIALTALTMSAWAEAPMPMWTSGNSYTVNQTYNVEGKTAPGSEDGFRMILSSTNSNWIVTDNGGAWTANFVNEPFQGAGHAKLSDPIPFDADIQLQNATGTGLVLLRGSDVNPTRVELTVSGDLFADMGGGQFVNIGTATMTVVFTFTEMMQDWSWPLYAGKSWTYTMSIGVTGAFHAIVMGNEINQPINETASYTITVSVASEWQLNGAQQGGTGALSHTYNPDCLWYGRKEMSNFQVGGTITLNQILWEMTNCNITVPPTPTPSMAPIDDELVMPDTSMASGDQFLLTLNATNSGPGVTGDVYVVLDVFGSYFFWPTWGMLSMEHETWTWAAAEMKSDTILSFTWPDVQGPVGPIFFYSIVTTPGAFDLLSDLAMVTWSYE